MAQNSNIWQQKNPSQTSLLQMHLWGADPTLLQQPTLQLTISLKQLISTSEPKHGRWMLIAATGDRSILR